MNVPKLVHGVKASGRAIGATRVQSGLNFPRQPIPEAAFFLHHTCMDRWHQRSMQMTKTKLPMVSRMLMGSSGCCGKTSLRRTTTLRFVERCRASNCYCVLNTCDIWLSVTCCGVQVCDRKQSLRDLTLQVHEEDGPCGVCCGCFGGCCEYYVCCVGCHKLYCTRKPTNATIGSDEAKEEAGTELV